MRFRTSTAIVIAISAALALSAAFIFSAAAAPGGHGHGHGSAHGAAVHGSSVHGGHTAVTKITFKLDDHSVVLGDMLTGPVLVQTHEGNHWVPLAGATLSLQIGKTEVATLVTDADGAATIGFAPTSAGDHVMRVVYAGDELHKKAQRAQGFNAADTGSPTPTPTPTDSPTESPTESPAP